MKKLYTFGLAFVLILSLSACRAKTPEEKQNTLPGPPVEEFSQDLSETIDQALDESETNTGVAGTYNNEGISFNYPDNWEKRDNHFGTLVMFLSPLSGSADDFQENVNIVLENLDEANKDISLDEYIEKSVSELEAFFDDYEVLSKEDGEIAGQRAKMVTYAMDQEETELKVAQIITIKDGTVYVVTYTATEDQFDINYYGLETVLGTFQFAE